MMVYLDMGITPDKLNDDGIIYKEDLTDIIEAKKMIAKGEERRRKEEAARARLRSKRR